MTQEAKLLGEGFYWQDLEVGQKFKTFKRTITETDIVNFISVTGMLETIFIDKTFNAGAIKGRPVPGALTYSIIEGMLMQTMVQGTGLALLEVHKKMLAPVVAGDTIWAEVEVTKVRPTSKLNRAVVSTHINIKNQDDITVISYDVTRMLSGR
ncbi:acyl dehydratase [Advenella alkanexedens]|jgi:acyl dehydratase|uniref:Acyl dehydratase n=1 Tax=Advenella alkanexedens TaxID=1481665 RepID=A0ABS6NMY2_9BURK|nr:MULTISPECIES: MaoC/PaaZ C-terminal domain-containing protein [Advenella]MBV4396989.1 acyl dehydratase [Advenella alkanexedens]MDD3756681.1 MaoC/PaaZ C-terminal domain-containing protein [Advenella sp.]NLN68136.1 acyl dehydratase [Alcaligenaceae bacterium]WKU20554.1 MaoC/PaaZ C-terminal domain-containing protein [Advenella alkanexedens]